MPSSSLAANPIQKIMKIKLGLSALFLGCSLGLSAQKTVQGCGFLDNWSVGCFVGGATPAAHAAFFGGMRPVYSVEMTKYIVPEFAMGARLGWANNTVSQGNALDATDLSLFGKINLSNWFASYNGIPRRFELEAMAAAGWGRHYFPSSVADDYDFMTSRFGLNFNFNLGENKAWTVSVRPALVYNLDNGDTHPVYHINHCAWEFQAGVIYHFKNANNGKHHFTLQRPYDPTRADALNAKVNDLLRMVKEKDEKLERLQQEVKDLRKALEEK